MFGLQDKIDFAGQQKAEQLLHAILSVSAALAFIFGFVLQDLRVTLGGLAVGVLGAAIVCIPPWGMYQKDPVKWLPKIQVADKSGEGGEGDKDDSTDVEPTPIWKRVLNALF
ncbi:hypothetical protein HK104_004151 [Borealophlyctis nickersoniae]|nr:hypothetical protein HK104_004151 [Borealophlyctis nickersoniae]